MSNTSEKRTVTKRDVLGYLSTGRNARVSNWSLTDEQLRALEDIQRDLFKLLDQLFPDWNTVNIEVVDLEVS